MTLPVEPNWYQTFQVDERIWRVTEPFVHPIFSANIFLVTGRDADLVIDSGMGVAPLRPVIDTLRPDPAKPLILFSTHTHVDHIGAAHEFETRLVHPLEAIELSNPDPYELATAGISDAFRTLFRTAGYPELWPYLISALPDADYDLEAYKLRPAPATGFVEDGDMVDLGDWRAEVLHLPGHSPGQVGLWHAESGVFFSADAIYDGPLIYEGADADLSAYKQTLRRLKTLPIKTVYGGHDDPFGKPHMLEIIAHYLDLWARLSPED